MKDFGYSEAGDRGAKSLSDLRLWRRILHFAAPFWPHLTLAVVISLFITGGTLALPALLQTGIDDHITNLSASADQRLSGLSLIALAYGALVILVFLASFAQTLVLEWVGQSVMHQVRQRLFSHLLHLDMPFFASQPTGRLVTRLTNDTQNMNEMFTSVIVTLFNDALRLLGILILLFYLNYRLAGALSLFVPVALLITVLFARLARERFRAIRNQLARLNSFLAEAIAGMSIIQLFGRQQSFRDSFEELSEGYLQRSLSQIRLFGTFMPLTEFLSSAAIAVILWYGGGEVLQSRLSLGELVAFISYMRLFFQPLRELSQKYSIVQSAMASAERIIALLDQKPLVSNPAAPKRPTSLRGEVTFSGVHFGYDPRHPILHDIDLTLQAGETVALVGTTGSGKTTLVNLLLRFYDPQAGAVLLDGQDIRDLELGYLRTTVGTILQDILILQDSLLTNIVMNSGKKREDVETILHQTGIARFVDKLPSGLDTMIGDGGYELSTGQKQLLAFARVLCRDPAILVLDEATAAIDTESENILEEALTGSFAGRTSLIIAHRLSTIRRADRIVVMTQGKILEEGTHEQLLAQQGHYAQLLALDLKNGNSPEVDQ